MPSPDDIPYVSLVKRLSLPDEIRDVPVLGNLYGFANAVIDYAESDCHPDWSVYVETLFPALGQVVLALIPFSLDDVLRGYFRPAGGRGFGGLGRASRRERRPTRAQRARGLLRGGIPELGELIGKHLPGAQVFAGRNVGNGEKWLWRLDGIAQRGLWWWLVADVLEDFTINWTTALMESEECRCGDSGGGLRQGAGSLFNATGAWADLPFTTLVDNWGGINVAQSSVHVPEGYSATVVASMDSYTPLVGDVSGVEVSVRRQSDGLIVGRSIPEGGIAPPQDRPRTASAHVPGGHTYQVSIRAFGGGTLSPGPREFNAWASTC